MAEPTPLDNWTTHPVYRLTFYEALLLYVVLDSIADELRGGWRGLLPWRRSQARSVDYVAHRVFITADVADSDGVELVEFEAPTYLKRWAMQAIEQGKFDLPPERVRWVENPHFTGTATRA